MDEKTRKDILMTGHKCPECKIPMIYFKENHIEDSITFRCSICKKIARAVVLPPMNNVKWFYSENNKANQNMPSGAFLFI